MTRHEKIKLMSAEELAEYLVEHIDCCMCRCQDTTVEWLESEVDDEE